MESYSLIPGCIFVDPSIPAEEIIKESVAVISMPFTSTAILGKMMNKPSIYYDPVGVIEKDDRAAHGLEVLSTKQELNEWFLNEAKKQNNESINTSSLVSKLIE